MSKQSKKSAKRLRRKAVAVLRRARSSARLELAAAETAAAEIREQARAAAETECAELRAAGAPRDRADPHRRAGTTPAKSRPGSSSRPGPTPTPSPTSVGPSSDAEARAVVAEGELQGGAGARRRRGSGAGAPRRGPNRARTDPRERRRGAGATDRRGVCRSGEDPRRVRSTRSPRSRDVSTPSAVNIVEQARVEAEKIVADARAQVEMQAKARAEADAKALAEVEGRRARRPMPLDGDTTPLPPRRRDGDPKTGRARPRTRTRRDTRRGAHRRAHHRELAHRRHRRRRTATAAATGTMRVRATNRPTTRSSRPPRTGRHRSASGGDSSAARADAESNGSVPLDVQERHRRRIELDHVAHLDPAVARARGDLVHHTVEIIGVELVDREVRGDRRSRRGRSHRRRA